MPTLEINIRSQAFGFIQFTFIFPLIFRHFHSNFVFVLFDMPAIVFMRVLFNQHYLRFGCAISPNNTCCYTSAIAFALFPDSMRFPCGFPFALRFHFICIHISSRTNAIFMNICVERVAFCHLSEHNIVDSIWKNIKTIIVNVALIKRLIKRLM